MTLTVSADEQCARIEVQDNGSGISNKNLTKIFNHGFTTKEEGHGYGLHSSALAAQELGGSLSAPQRRTRARCHIYPTASLKEGNAMQSVTGHINRRILVIDDNPAIHDDFRKILVPDGACDELNKAEAAFFGGL